MINMISICSSNAVIGLDNRLPFSYPEDMKYFRKMTYGCSVIMGRKTYESLGSPLKNRRNIVVSSQRIDNIETYKTLSEAIEACSEPIPLVGIMEEIKISKKPIWLIGGASIYEEGMRLVNEIHLTIAKNEFIENKNAVKFPWINPLRFELVQKNETEDLVFCIYKNI